MSLGWRAWLLVLSISAVLCCFQLGSARSLTEHEIYVAAGAKQMAHDHDWFFPKIGDHLWLEKPPLLHWLTISSATLFGGFSEAAVRFPSVVAGMGLVIIMTKLALHWFGSRVAVFTGLVQTTTVYFITYARLAEAEMLLAFLIILALFVFVRLHSIGPGWPKPRPYLSFLFWELVGVSNLAKGLGFGPALILAPCAVFLILKHDCAAWRRMISWSGMAFGLVTAVAWPVFVAHRFPDARNLWLTEAARHALGWTGFRQPWWYYLSTTPWQLLPWTPALLFSAGCSLSRAWRELDSPDRFIWCWGLVPIALLSLVHGKHQHYIISCLCSFSPLCALGLLRCGYRSAIVCVALALAGTLFVHAYILRSFDRSHDDREFLMGVRKIIPSDKPLLATGGPEIARAIFYIDPPPLGVGVLTDLNAHFSATEFYVITRRREEPYLATLGHVDVINQSLYTRAERDPSDRFALFKIQPLGAP